MIKFHSENFMFKKTVNRMLNANYVSKIWDIVSILDSKDNLISYHSSYLKEFEDAVENNGISGFGLYGISCLSACQNY